MVALSKTWSPLLCFICFSASSSAAPIAACTFPPKAAASECEKNEKSDPCRTLALFQPIICAIASRSANFNQSLLAESALLRAAAAADSTIVCERGSQMHVNRRWPAAMPLAPKESFGALFSSQQCRPMCKSAPFVCQALVAAYGSITVPSLAAGNTTQLNRPPVSAASKQPDPEPESDPAEKVMIGNETTLATISLEDGSQDTYGSDQSAAADEKAPDSAAAVIDASYGGAAAVSPATAAELGRRVASEEEDAGKHSSSSKDELRKSGDTSKKILDIPTPALSKVKSSTQPSIEQKPIKSSLPDARKIVYNNDIV